jgi:hypothetical protein
MSWRLHLSCAVSNPAACTWWRGQRSDPSSFSASANCKVVGVCTPRDAAVTGVEFITISVLVDAFTRRVLVAQTPCQSFAAKLALMSTIIIAEGAVDTMDAHSRLRGMQLRRWESQHGSSSLFVAALSAGKRTG